MDSGWCPRSRKICCTLALTSQDMVYSQSRSKTGRFFTKQLLLSRKKYILKTTKKACIYRLFLHNGAYEIRTHGLNNANVARSQLRQCPMRLI